MKFNINPVFVTKVLLDKYVHEISIYDGTKDPEFFSAINLFLQSQTHDDYMDLINEYLKREKIKTLTFEDWVNDCKKIISIIEESGHFNRLYQSAKGDSIYNYNWFEDREDA